MVISLKSGSVESLCHSIVCVAIYRIFVKENVSESAEISKVLVTISVMCFEYSFVIDDYLLLLS